jgi:hypothetical protein
MHELFYRLAATPYEFSSSLGLCENSPQKTPKFIVSEKKVGSIIDVALPAQHTQL